MGRQRRRLAALVVLGLMMAGCGSGKRVAERPADPVASVLRSAQADLRKVVHTADLTVRVADARRATDQAARIVTDTGGFVFAQTSDMEGRRETRLTLKVPPDRFEPVLTVLGDLGQSLRRDSKTQDVTDTVIDAEGRLRTALASADRLRALLADARSTADIVGVEGELAKRESEIESLQGRLRVLDSQVDLATVNLRLTERGDIAVNREVPAFPTAVRAGWVVLANLALAGVAIGGFLLPFTPLAVFGWCALRRRRAA
jgi:hypothetical protein